ncbi:XRE family transcriptional regulator, partial [Dietzia sp. UCD-THP]|uniref:XRE family transcriptional regulator n=1 Tax=Dietzia sp. UCD-THP TaxID=1292020 RepID=UPI0012682D18
ELARRIGITRQNLHHWRTHGVRGLPARTTLEGVAAELRLPYVQVLEAALRDAGYLDDAARLIA